MTQSELKELTNLGAELGAAKAENERLSGLLHDAHDTIRNLADDLDEEEFRVAIDQLVEIELALAPQQAEPDHDCNYRTGGVICKVCDLNVIKQAEDTDTFTAADMATAAAQGFRDGQAAVEQAAAQDEQEVAAVIGFYEGEREPRLLSWNVLPNGEHRLYTRPEQTEQQPVAWLPYLSDGADGVTGHYAIARKNPAGYREVWNLRSHHWAAFSDEVLTLDEALAILKKLEMPTAPIAQIASQTAPGESWIPWRGGECPVPPSTPVEYRMRRDARSVVRIDLAGKLDWEHHGGRIGKSDVVAYRAALSAQGESHE